MNADMMLTDIETFLTHYRQTVPRLSDAAAGGLRNLLEQLGADHGLTDLRWAAYMLATVRHECAETWLPIEEYGRGKGRPYGLPVSGHTYYGRGYVQLTWHQNYAKLGETLGMGKALAENPALALDSATAYRIMSIGMRRGLFTGKKLSDYIEAERCDYRGARRIINGQDQAERIAGYASHFEQLLLKCTRAC